MADRASEAPSVLPWVEAGVFQPRAQTVSLGS